MRTPVWKTLRLPFMILCLLLSSVNVASADQCTECLYGCQALIHICRVMRDANYSNCLASGSQHAICDAEWDEWEFHICPGIYSQCIANCPCGGGSGGGDGDFPVIPGEDCPPGIEDCEPEDI